ncbi:MAG TPA: rod shape-determining protein MreC [Caulobacteraceae bacterium]
MSLRDGPLGEIKPPLVWLAAGALIIGILAALALFALGGARTGPFGDARRAADGLIAPAGGVLAMPVRVAAGGAGVIQDYFFAGSQNRELRGDLAAALSWRDEALTLRQENARLRALLGVRTEPPLPMVAAETVLDARGPFSNSRLANAGSVEGVTEGNPVLSEHGLVGRIVGVGAHVSRIMLLSDVDSRTPVMIARTNGRAILTGDGGSEPELAYLRTHDALQVGDRVLTSGDGGVVPRGLPVGAATKGLDGTWRVALDSDAEPIDFVRVLLFKDFVQVASPTELTPSQMPNTATDAPEAPASAPVPLAAKANIAKPAPPGTARP